MDLMARRRQMIAAASGKRQIIWNQLIYNGNFAEGGNTPTGWKFGYGVTADNSDTDVIVFSGKYYLFQLPYQSQFVLDTQHIYYLCCIAKYGNGGDTTGYIYPYWALPNGTIYKFNTDRTWTTFRKISIANKDGTSSSNGLVRFFNSNSYITIDKNAGVQLFDLTLMFGAGNEPTAEQFDAMFGTPYTYHPFNLGEVIYI